MPENSEFRHRGKFPHHRAQFPRARRQLLQRHRHIEFVDHPQRTERLRLPLAVLPQPFDFAGIQTDDDVPILQHRSHEPVPASAVGHFQQREQFVLLG